MSADYISILSKRFSSSKIDLCSKCTWKLKAFHAIDALRAIPILPSPVANLPDLLAYPPSYRELTFSTDYPKIGPTKKESLLDVKEAIRMSDAMPSPSLASNLALLESGEYSDMILKCGTDMYKLHRSPVCSRSDVIQRALDGKLKEDREGVFDLPEDEYNALTVSRVVAFLYQNDYDCGMLSPPHIKARPWRELVHNETAQEVLSRMRVNAAIHQLAEFFNVQDLKRMANEKFRILAQKHWIELPADLVELVPAIWGTDENDIAGFQDPILEKCVDIYKEITTDAECASMMQQFPDFSIGLLQAVGERLNGRTEELQQNRISMGEEISAITDKAKRRDKELGSKISNLEIVYERLTEIVTKRLRSSLKNGKVNALREDIAVIMGMIQLYCRSERWPWELETED